MYTEKIIRLCINYKKGFYLLLKYHYFLIKFSKLIITLLTFNLIFLKIGTKIITKVVFPVASTKSVESSIRTKLQNHFHPKVLQVINESHMHHVPEGSESHFKVVVVSDRFEGMSLIMVV